MEGALADQDVTETARLQGMEVLAGGVGTVGDVVAEQEADVTLLNRYAAVGLLGVADLPAAVADELVNKRGDQRGQTGLHLVLLDATTAVRVGDG